MNKLIIFKNTIISLVKSLIYPFKTFCIPRSTGLIIKPSKLNNIKLIQSKHKCIISVQGKAKQGRTHFALIYSSLPPKEISPKCHLISCGNSLVNFARKTAKQEFEEYQEKFKKQKEEKKGEV